MFPYYGRPIICRQECLQNFVIKQYNIVIIHKIIGNDSCNGAKLQGTCKHAFQKPGRMQTIHIDLSEKIAYTKN